MSQRRPNVLVTQSRVLFALVMREMATRFGHSATGYLWAVAEPAGFIALLSILFAQFTHDPPYGQSFPMFYATGYLAFALYSDTARVCARSMMVNRALLNFPVVTPLDTVLARFLLQLLTWGVASALILAGIVIVFAEPARPAIGPLMQLAGLGALLALGAGLCNAVLFSLSKSWELVFELLSRPLFLISAVFFSYDSLPLVAREILWWNPVIHLVGLMRQGFYPVYDGAHVSPAYLLVLGLALTVAGLALITGLAGRMAEA